jgi:hypothetical protein
MDRHAHLSRLASSEIAAAPELRSRSENCGLSPLGLARFDHGLLNLIGQAGHMQGQPIEHFPLRRVSGEIANPPTFGRVRSEFFEVVLVVLHGGHSS